MRGRSIAGIVIVALAAGVASGAHSGELHEHQQTLARGRIVYERACLWCHGAGGRGDGPAGWQIGRFRAPRPRDFVAESFKFRSTPSGTLPTDQDLFRVISRGIRGVMPPFGALLEAERWDVIAYIKSFNPAFQSERPVPLPIPQAPPSPSDETIARGRSIYRKFGCQSCHGEDGRGSSLAEAELTDARGLAIRPPDLTTPSSFKNGSRPQDIYRTLITGLDGTPMPSYGEILTDREDDGWALVNYLLSLADHQGP